MADVYDASEIIDKALVTNKALPYYLHPPDTGYIPTPAGTFQSGDIAGTVYGWLDQDPARNRNTLWWIFYPGATGDYYYMPHHSGDFNIDVLQSQGAQTEADKNAAEQTWYEKILTQVLPVVAISVLGAALIRGYFSSKKN